MIRILVMLIACSVLAFIPTNGICETNLSDSGIIFNRDIYEINISVTIKPIKDSEYCYNFSTNNKSQIDYIVHLLNSMSLIDDGKVLSGGDIPIVNIDITQKDGLVDKIGFVSERFYDVNGKQYAVDRNEYNRFLNFIYALKTEKIILDDEVTFEPSKWAKEDVEKAIESGLVPSFNQINYKGKINRLEVCQLINNLLDRKNLVNNNSANNPFSDTTDKTVINLFHFGVINGKSDSEFYPYDLITRQEFAKILSKTYYLINGAEPNKESHEYSDQNEISDWVLNDVNDMHSLKIMVGNANNEFKPKDSITKEEVIVTITRISK